MPFLRRPVDCLVPYFAERGWDYGSVVVALGFLGLTLTSPGQASTIGTTMRPLSAELHVDTDALSELWFLATALSAATLPLFGRLLDRTGAALVFPLVVMAMGLSALFYANIGEASSGTITTSATSTSAERQVVLALYLLRVSGNGALWIVSIHAVNQWYVEKRAKIQGRVMFGAGCSLLWFASFSEARIKYVGWREAYREFGMFELFVFAPLAWMFQANRPEVYGLGVDGARRHTDNHPGTGDVEIGLQRLGGVVDRADHAEAFQSAGDEGTVLEPGAAGTKLRPNEQGNCVASCVQQGREVEVNLPLGQAIRTKQFWIYTATMALTGALNAALLIHLAVILQRFREHLPVFYLAMGLFGALGSYWSAHQVQAREWTCEEVALWANIWQTLCFFLAAAAVAAASSNPFEHLNVYHTSGPPPASPRRGTSFPSSSVSRSPSSAGEHESKASPLEASEAVAPYVSTPPVVAADAEAANYQAQRLLGGDLRMLSARPQPMRAVPAALPTVMQIPFLFALGMLQGLGTAFNNTLQSTAHAVAFGREHNGAIQGFAKSVMVVGSAVGPGLLTLLHAHVGAVAGGSYAAGRTSNDDGGRKKEDHVQGFVEDNFVYSCSMALLGCLPVLLATAIRGCTMADTNTKRTIRNRTTSTATTATTAGIESSVMGDREFDRPTRSHPPSRAGDGGEKSDPNRLDSWFWLSLS